MSRPDRVRAGAEAFRGLVQRICHKAEADLEDSLDDDDRPDLMDYRAMANMIADSLTANFVSSDADHREGFLRALSDTLLFAWDGSAPGDDWDPIGRTEAAFAAPEAVFAALDAARRSAKHGAARKHR